MAKFLFLFVAIVIGLLAFLGNGKEKNKVIYTSKAPAPIGVYSQAIVSDGTMFVSGQIGLNPKRELDSSTIENECGQALQNIKFILEAGEMSLNDVCKATVYLTDLKNFPKINEIYKSYFPINPPARETVEVKALPKVAHIEISVIAKK